MLFRLRFLLLFPLASLIACGVGTSSPPRVSYDLSGNWVVTADTTAPVLVSSFVGFLEVTDHTVTGMLIPEPFCFDQPTVSGTVDGAGNLSLTMPVSGGTATITATIGNPQTPTDGSFQIIGGPCAIAATPMTITQYAPVTGTYVGTYPSPIQGVPVTITAVLTQSTTPNSVGEFPLTGTAALSGACSATFTLSDGYVAGSSVSAVNLMGVQPFSGTINPAASTITGKFGLGFGTACDATYTGPLTRQ